MPTVLIVDDEAPMRQSMQYLLEREGYRVVAAENGTVALQAAAQKHPDLVILDIMLPDIDGLEITRRMRQETGIPILMVSARGDEIDKVVGLEVGADDYLVKPIGPREFIARVRAALRRGSRARPSHRLEAGAVVIDLARRSVTVRGQAVDMPRKEFELLRVLAEHSGQVVPRQELLEAVWGEDFYGEEKTLDVHVSRLRQRLEEDPDSPRLIQTVRGVGYVFAPDA